MWSLAVVVPLKLHKVFVPCIGCMQGLRMMGLDEVVIVCCRKKSRDEAFLHVADRREVVYVEVSFAFDARVH